MRIVRLRGSYRDIGIASGRNLSLSRSDLSVSAAGKRRMSAHEEDLRRWAPQLAAEISGLEEAWESRGGNTEHLLQHVLNPSGPDPACTALYIGAEHTQGRPLFGRNCDFRPSAHQRAALYFTYPAEAYPHLGFSHGPIGRYGGVNGEGLMVATAVVPPRGSEGTPGITFTLAVRCILDRHRTVGEACRFLRSIPHIRGVNFLLADSQGGSAVVEAAPERVRVLDSGGEFAAITNHFQSIPERTSRPRLAESRSRLRTLKRWFTERSSPVRETDVQRLLVDRSSGVFADGDPAFPHSTVTLWSWTGHPGSRTVHVALGFPDRGPYHPHRL